jgi:inosine-uridine nucleoside N-ribohydrolase
MRLAQALLACLSLAGNAAFAGAAEKPKPAPVLFDTDIGTDIDDVYALVALMTRPELRLLGVTTVSSDAVERARLAAKLLGVAGGKWASVPVYAGTSTPPQSMRQAEWARGFTSPSLHTKGGVDFLRREIERRPGEITIIAVGELTNVAALLESQPGIGRKIKAISLMGGSIYRGYAAGSKPEREWNIKSNPKAAQAVFESGVPLLVAPLDSTADLKLTAEMRVELFRRGLPLYDAVAALNSIWRHTNTGNRADPTLFDVLAVELVNPRVPYELMPLHVAVAPDGLTLPVSDGKANAQIAIKVDSLAFMRTFVERLTR